MTKFKQITFFLFFGLTIFLASILYLQYPLSSTFPIGGDATRYILDYLEVKNAWQHQEYGQAISSFFHNTQYPLSQAVIAISAFIPVAWPLKFIYLMTLAQIATGLSIAFLLYKHQNKEAAVYGFFIWALTTSQVTGHTQDATIAQLISLIPLIFFLHFFLKEKWLPAIILLITSFLFHPVTGVVASLIYIVTLTAALSFRKSLTLSQQQFIRKNLYVAPVAGVLIALFFFSRFHYFSAITVDTNTFSLPDIVNSPFGFFVLIAPFGLLIWHEKTKESFFSFFILLSFTFVSLFTAFNDFLCIDVMPHRFKTYVILAVTVLAATALPTIFTKLFSLQAKLVLFILFASLTAASWHENGSVFSFYESPRNYARLHTDEQAAIIWINEHTNPEDAVLTTKENRHSEWVPILGEVTWIGKANNDPVWFLPTSDFKLFAEQQNITYVLLLKHREKAKDILQGKQNDLPLVFENKGAQIYEITH